MKASIWVIALLTASLCNAQTGSWSWVRQDQALNPSGLVVENFNAQFDVLDWNGDGLWDFVINDFTTPQLLIGVDLMPTTRWQRQPLILPTIEPNSFTYDPPLAFQFVDFDHDGDFDLAADGGQFWWNIGTNSYPSWQIDDSVLFEIREHLRYSFVDYDDDGDWDLSAGYTSYPDLYWNTTGGVKPTWIADTTEISAPLADFVFNPVYRDMNKDGKPDLFALQQAPVDPIACYNLLFYQNSGTLFAPKWELQSSSVHFAVTWCGFFGGPNYKILDFDLDGDMDVLTRSSIRDFHFYKNISSADSVFLDSSHPSRLGPITVKSNAIPFLFDNLDDGNLDLIVSEDFLSTFISYVYDEGSVVSFASDNGGFDLNNSKNGWFVNPYPIFVANFAKSFHFNFNDFDRDGDSDYLFSYYRMATFPQDTINESRVIFFRNLGTNTAPNWTADSSLFAQFDKSPELFWAPNLIDIDNDSDDELFIKRGEDFFFYEQVAAGPPLQWQVRKNFMSGIQPSDSHYLATFADLTRDGLPDLIFGEEDGTLAFYENVGSPNAPDWQLNPQVFAGINVDSLAAPAFGDIDHDGRLDMFIGNADGKIFFYRNESTVDVEQTHPDSPAEFQLSSSYPNPFNARDFAPTTTFDFQLPRAARISLKIYNILGQEIKTLIDDHFQAGRHHIQWDGRDQFDQPVAVGIYLINLRAGEFVQTRKFTLIR